MIKKIIFALIVFSMPVLNLNAFADDASKTKKSKKSMSSEVTPEQRKNMADMHEKMAACLRSDKSIDDCHNEMRDQCRTMMGKEGCPHDGMMGTGMGKKGWKHE